MNKKTLILLFVIVSLLFLMVFIIKFISFTGKVVDDRCVADYQCGTWSACENGIERRTCNDFKCGQENIIERRVCAELFCENTDYQCGTWSSCVYTEKVEDVFNNEISFKGFQERVCRDVTGCGADKKEERKCQEINKIEFKVKEFCGESFLTAIDLKTGKPVGKIKLSSWELKKLDISFIQNDKLYCESCYNGIIDPDELGVDCGGNCKECADKLKNNIDVYKRISFGSSLILLAVLFGILVFEYQGILKNK